MRLLILLLLLPLGGIAQPYGFLSWGTAEGLPQSQVYALVEDDYGFIWAGTRGGGVARFDGEAFETYTTAAGLPGNFIEKLWVAGDGRVFAQTENGTAGFDAAADRWYPAEASPPEGQELADRFPDVPHPVVALKLPNGGRLVASRTNGLYLLEAGGNLLRHYTENNSDLPHNSVRALLEDRQGRFWIGTSGGGLTRMIPTGMTHYDRADGLRGNRVYALHEGPGRLWIGAGKTGVQYRDSTGFHGLPGPDPTAGVKISSIGQDLRGRRIYFATDGRGIAVVNDTLGVERLTVADGLPSDWVMKIFSGEDAGIDEVWAATYTDGLAHIVARDSAYEITNYNLPESRRPLRLTSALRNDAQEFFFGTKNGTIHRWRWREGATEMQTQTFGPPNGLPAAPVRALALRRQTQLWAAVAGHGLFYTDLRMENVRFFPVPERLKISTNIFQLTAPPDRPEIWVGTERGVDRLLLNTDGQPDVVRHYGRAEGFAGGETTGASLIDSAGDLWFGTMNGLARYEQAEPGGYLAPPPTFLAGVDVFYTPLDSLGNPMKDGRTVLRAKDNHLNFRFRAVDLTYPDRVRYRYRMTGFSNDWSPLTEETSVRFAGLSSGSHTFSVEATTDGGKTFGKAAGFAFVIERPLVSQSWFLGLLALLGCGVLIGGFYGVYRRVQRREALLRQELEARNQLLELEQKALRLQMNPHFIFNALNGIRGLVDGRHDAEARQQISRFATLMRGILNNSRAKSIPLADEIKVLEDYLEMEQFCQPFPFTYTISVADNIDPEEVSMPPMLLQPFVENAVLHGLSGLNAAGHIDVTFSLRGRRMQCLVEDNGIGRAAAAARRNPRTPGHKSVALDVTRARLKAMNGRLTIADREGGGTTVEVLVPVEMW